MSPPAPERDLLIVVDDDPGTGLLEQRELTRRGYRVLVFESADAALVAPERLVADAWLIDQMLQPQRTGLDLVAELRRQGIGAPVVLVTGTDDPDVVLRALRAGVGDFVRKGDGFLELLVKRVDAVIVAARAERDLQLSRARTEFEGERRRELEAEIAERRRAEAQAHAALARLREADQRKDEFLAMLGHELRNPLAPITSAVEVLKRAPDDRDQVVAAAGIIGRQVDQMARLVDDLLDVARIMNGRLQLRRGAVDLRDVVERAIERALPNIRAAGHDLQHQPSSVPLVVDGDAVRLTQVLANLLDNATKYTPGGGRIAIDLRREGEHAELAVQDSGIGMAAADIDGMFGLFVQGERTPDRREGGLGLGLSLARRLVAMHGGEISASSAGPGRGSRFALRLPLLDANAQPPVAPSAAVTRDVERAAERAAGVRLLVVDDNVDAATAIAMLLRLWGAEVSIAHDGNEAVECVRTFDPHAVLLDLGLPGLDGCEVLAAAQAVPAARQRLWIAITGYGQDADRERTRIAGFDAHLVKPVEAGALRAALARVMAT